MEESAPPSFVGEATCATCHATEAAAWRGSHHQRAMQPANTETVLGDFANAHLKHNGVTSRFSKRGDVFVASTEGADGKLHDYEVTHTFGVAPLQQYLVAFPNGRSQALALAWDSRASNVGGQRWFDLAGGEKIAPTDPLHWAGVTQNWNYMCADCHSTHVRKGYNPQSGEYKTSFAEMSVSCEACHGPGSQHVAWANLPEARRSENKGLSIALNERNGATWTRNAVTGKPQRSTPRQTERELDMCGRCHARRGLVHEDSVHGQPLADDYRVALLDSDLYFPDGQIKDEVYEYGSFIQSRMFAAGVTCSDCHEPHSSTLRASGDGVCLQCHGGETYATNKHHFHAEASAGARCVSCHMPTTTYMEVDERHDHSLRVPRPDLSVTLGVPNPCTSCHANKTSTWAAQKVATWYGHKPSGFQQFAHALAHGTEGAPGAQAELAALVNNKEQPAIARASALARMEGQISSETLSAVRDALADKSALVRRAAVRALADTDPRLRAALLPALLSDAVRTVRIEAADMMAGVPNDLLTPTALRTLGHAFGEFVAEQGLNSDRPESHLKLAGMLAAQGRFVETETALKKALQLEPNSAPALVNLADLYRTLQRDAEAEPLLRNAVALAPTQPALSHALGLVLVRLGRVNDSLQWLQVAAQLAPNNARYGYVYSVALHDSGQSTKAVQQLKKVLKHNPYDADSLAALAVFLKGP